MYHKTYVIITHVISCKIWHIRHITCHDTSYVIWCMTSHQANNVAYHRAETKRHWSVIYIGLKELILTLHSQDYSGQTRSISWLLMPWTLYYYSDLMLSQSFHPMAAQLSMKAVFPLVKSLVTASCHSGNRGPGSSHGQAISNHDSFDHGGFGCSCLPLEYISYCFLVLRDDTKFISINISKVYYT